MDGSYGVWHVLCNLIENSLFVNLLTQLKQNHMKTYTLLITLLFVGVLASAKPADAGNLSPFNYGESFIFVEGGVEFSVYPNGEFDFYYNPQFARTSIAHIPVPSNNISYNAGFNYDPFVQYDDFGAVIQIENVPVYYDYYGRIVQAGNIFLNYNSRGHLVRVGNMHIRYNRFNQPIKYVGFINSYNTSYVYRPWHRYYVRPHQSYRVVYYEPYRAYYQPYRVEYGQYVNFYETNNYNVNRNDFYRPGQQVNSYNHGRRTVAQREVQPLRSSQNVSRNSSSEVGSLNAEVRSNRSPVSENRSRNETNSSRRGYSRELSNIEKHQNAVQAQRSSQRSTSRESVSVQRRTPVNNSTEINNRNAVQQSGRRSSQPALQNRQSSGRQPVTTPRSPNVQTSTPINSNSSNIRSRSSSPRSNEVKAISRNTREGRSSSRGGN